MVRNIRILVAGVLAAAAFAVAACEVAPSATPNRDRQAQAARAAAERVTFNGNSEVDNIAGRLQLTGNPNMLGFVVLLNEAGQPIMYTSVRGKITSGGKRLTPPDAWSCEDPGAGVGVQCNLRPAPSDEGTYGSSNPYVYFKTAEGQYIQWTGHYLYSDRPFRLSVQPLVIQGIAASTLAAAGPAQAAPAQPVATPGAAAAAPAA